MGPGSDCLQSQSYAHSPRQLALKTSTILLETSPSFSSSPVPSSSSPVESFLEDSLYCVHLLAALFLSPHKAFILLYLDYCILLPVFQPPIVCHTDQFCVLLSDLPP